MGVGQMNDNQKKKGKENFIRSCLWALRSFSTSMPLLMGIILLMGLFQNFIPPRALFSLFSGSIPGDTFLGAAAGSIFAGNAVSSYIIGAELLKKGVSMFGVMAFVVTWVTVGITQLPAEAGILGRKFAITRNLLSFVMALLVAVATTLTWMVF
jgi:uncharacterized membrane protein YraQ (UPF0718 family)